MTLSILAVLFLLFLVGAIFYGYGFMMKKGKASVEMGKGECILCGRKFDVLALVARQVGDYKLLYFCKECIGKLYVDAHKA